jgi:hypothetical protein
MLSCSGITGHCINWIAENKRKDWLNGDIRIAILTTNLYVTKVEDALPDSEASGLNQRPRNQQIFISTKQNVSRWKYTNRVQSATQDQTFSLNPWNVGRCKYITTIQSPTEDTAHFHLSQTKGGPAEIKWQNPKDEMNRYSATSPHKYSYARTYYILFLFLLLVVRVVRNRVPWQCCFRWAYIIYPW